MDSKKIMKTAILGPKCPIAPNFGKSVTYFYILWYLICCKVSEKNNERILSKLWKQSFWAQKCPIAPNFGKIRIFPQKTNLSLFYILWCLTCCKVSEKSNERILCKLRKQSFWAQKCPIAPNFGKIRIFHKKTNPSLFYILWCLSCCKVSEKSNERILRKVRYGRKDGRTEGRTDRRTEGRTEGQGWNYRTPPTALPPGVQKV